MADVYDYHAKAFAQVSAYVILDADGKLVAKVAFKFPKEGPSRVWSYIHILGTPMVRGKADGGGYDKASAAFANACERLKLRDRDTVEPTAHDIALANHIGQFQALWMHAEGRTWDAALERAGYRVLQAV